MNCKPGDLAIIVRSAEGRNLGAIVEILHVDDLETSLSEVLVWRVRACSPLRRMDGAVTTDGCVPDWRLRPISGVPVEDEVTDEVPA